MESKLNKLVDEFGCELLTDKHLNKIINLSNKKEDAKNKLLSLYKSGILVSNRDLDQLFDAYEKGEKFYIYTGRGPSSGSLHLGHLLPFLATKYLQELFDCPVFVQLSTDEKFLRDGLSLEEVEEMAMQNTKDILSIGFNIDKTRIVSNFKSIKDLYPTIMKICRNTSSKQMKSIFGIEECENSGSYFFPAVESAPSFPCSLNSIIKGYDRCLVILGLDQDPYFRLARDVAFNLNSHKPSLLHTSFIPGLKGIYKKMSSSDPTSAIFISDNKKTILNKIKRYAFSGGRETLELHKKFGANIEVDVCVFYLKIFGRLVSFSEYEIDNIINEYKKGILSTLEIKKIVSNMIFKLFSTFVHNTQNNEQMEQITSMTPIL